MMLISPDHFVVRSFSVRVASGFSEVFVKCLCAIRDDFEVTWKQFRWSPSKTILHAIGAVELIMHGLIVPLSKSCGNLESILYLTTIPGRIRLDVGSKMVSGVPQNRSFVDVQTYVPFFEESQVDLPDLACLV